MRHRLLGPSGLRVSQLFLGAMTFPGPEEARRAVDLYQDAGGNVIDTASAYGDSEENLGEILQGRRDRFVLSTKFALPRDPSDPNSGGSHRKNLVLSLEQSLRRLGTDYIDLLWVHTWDAYTPVEETLRALDDVVRSGKVLYVGASNVPAWVVSRANTLARWQGRSPFVALQVPYSLLHRDIERELLPMAEALGLSVATYGGLAGGILSGRYTGPDAETGGGRLDPSSLTEREHRVARTVQKVAAQVGASPSQVATAWTMARSPLVHPIVGSSSARQLTDTLDAAGLGLPAQAMEELNAAVDFTLGYPGELNASTQDWLNGDHEVVPPVWARAFDVR